jgi:hypothetical protein
MTIAKHPTTDAEDHWAVPLHQEREGGLVVLPREALQELRVG